MMLRLMLWWEKVKQWFDYGDCPKQSLGYNCHHRIMSNGQKECGKDINYWGGSDD